MCSVTDSEASTGLMKSSEQKEIDLKTFESLLSSGKETPVLDFKSEMPTNDRIGEYVSSLSNSAALEDREFGYLVWGVEDDLTVVGNGFDPESLERMEGNENLSNWLISNLSPRPLFRFAPVTYQGKSVGFLEVPRAKHGITHFKDKAKIRVGSEQRKLSACPELHTKLLRGLTNIHFENEIAQEGKTADEVIELLDINAYYSLSKVENPGDIDSIMHHLEVNQIAMKMNGHWGITNLGALLLAKDLAQFSGLRYKCPRIIRANEGKVMKDFTFDQGIASGFEEFCGILKLLLPEPERYEHPFLRAMKIPENAMRELVANALIHQDFEVAGSKVMITINNDSLEIASPGGSQVREDRLLDEAPWERNPALARLMHKFKLCEARGRGIDMVFESLERDHMAPPIFISSEHSFRVFLKIQKFEDMDNQERAMACYWHACLHYSKSRAPIGNKSLRERFDLPRDKTYMVTQCIKVALENNLIKLHKEGMAKKSRRYVPYWANSKKNAASHD